MKNPQLLDLYSDFCLTSFAAITATGLSKLLDEGYSHDQISRFMGQRTFDQKDFWKTVKRLVRKIEHESGVVSIDDTISDKPHSTENDIICYHWDHCVGRAVKGVNILNFAYHSTLPDGQGVTLPLAFEVIRKTEQYYDKKSEKVKRRSPVTKNELVRERLYVLTKYNRVRYRYVVWDSWFSSKENLGFVHHDLKKHFVVALKANRKVALSGQGKRQGQYQKAEELGLQKDQCRMVWLKGVDFPVQLAKQVFTNKDGSTGELYLITNDLGIGTASIFATYEKRWGVEVMHKSLKQNAGLEKSPTKYEVTQVNHIFASMVAYCKLEVLKVRESSNHFALKSRLYLKALKAAYQELLVLKGQPEMQATPLLGQLY